MKTVLIATLFTAAFFLQVPQPAASQATPDSASAPATAMSEGEVRKVDMDAKKITLRHGPIANLGMPPMTMVFQVRDLSLLEQVKAGDRIRFRAEKIGGAFTVTQIGTAD